VDVCVINALPNRCAIAFLLTSSARQPLRTRSASCWEVVGHHSAVSLPWTFALL
jgi:hypothetical protein